MSLRHGRVAEEEVNARARSRAGGNELMLQSSRVRGHTAVLPHAVKIRHTKWP